MGTKYTVKVLNVSKLLFLYIIFVKYVTFHYLIKLDILLMKTNDYSYFALI